MIPSKKQDRVQSVIVDLLRSATRVAVLLLVLGAVQWLTMARIVRGQVLSLKHREYVLAARALGAGPTCSPPLRDCVFSQWACYDIKVTPPPGSAAVADL